MTRGEGWNVDEQVYREFSPLIKRCPHYDGPVGVRLPFQLPVTCKQDPEKLKLPLVTSRHRVSHTLTLGTWHSR